MFKRVWDEIGDKILGRCPKKSPFMMASLNDPKLFRMLMIHKMESTWFFTWKAPAIFMDGALGNCFVWTLVILVCPRRWLSPSSSCHLLSQAVIYDRRIVSLDNRSHYLGWNWSHYCRRGFSFFHRKPRALVMWSFSCGRAGYTIVT